MNFLDKYLKYKNKYLNLKKMFGGSASAVSSSLSDIKEEDLPHKVSIIERFGVDVFLNIIMNLDFKETVKLLFNSSYMLRILYDESILKEYFKDYNFSQLDQQLLISNQYYDQICKINIKQIDDPNGRTLLEKQIGNCLLFLVKLKLIIIYKRIIKPDKQIEIVIFSNELLNKILLRSMQFSEDKISDIRDLQDFIDSLTPVGSKITKIEKKHRIYLPNIINNLTIPNCVTTIDENCFNNKKVSTIKISNLILPPSVNTINNYAFAYNRLKTLELPNTLTIINSNTFKKNKLTRLIIPDSVSIIKDFAFAYNKLIYLQLPITLEKIESSAFESNRLEELIIPNTVTTIENGAFKDNNLEKLTIPDSVTNIGPYAFANNNLEELQISNSIETIEPYAFADNNLTELNIPNSVKVIEHKAFVGNRLTKITIPNSVQIINSEAFFNNGLTEITIPDSVRFIGDGAFFGNPLAKITMPQRFFESVNTFCNSIDCVLVEL